MTYIVFIAISEDFLIAVHGGTENGKCVLTKGGAQKSGVAIPDWDGSVGCGKKLGYGGTVKFSAAETYVNAALGENHGGNRIKNRA